MRWFVLALCLFLAGAGFAHARQEPRVMPATCPCPAGCSCGCAETGVCDCATPKAGKPATLRVRLPADARLTIDGRPTTQAGARRTFVSAPLAHAGTYTLVATAVRGGKTITRRQTCRVRPGRATAVTFAFPAEVRPAPRAVGFAPMGGFGGCSS